MMTGIAIVEDDEQTSLMLEEMCNRYGKEKGIGVKVARYSNAMVFLEKYRSDISIVLMDIRMPDMDGYEAAKRLRESDKNVVIIFITSMAQYAVKGYEVNALNFMIKPARYTDLVYTLDRAIDKIRINELNSVKVQLSTSRGLVVLSSRDIVYVEALKHRILYHTADDVYDIYGVLGDVEKVLTTVGFARCNSCYLVNMLYVRWMKRYKVLLSVKEKEVELVVSRSKYKKVFEALKKYLKDE